MDVAIKNYHKVSLLWLFLFCCITLDAKSLDVPDLSKFSSPEAGSGKVVFSESFDGRLRLKKLPSGYKVEAGKGRNGSAALLCRRTDIEDYDSAVVKYPVKLKSGRFYRLSAWYKVADIKGKNKGDVHLAATASMEFLRDGVYQRMVNPHEKLNSEEWKEVSFEFQGGEENNLILRLFYDVTGSVWWDDVKITEVADKLGIVYPVRPYMLSLDEKGSMAFKAYVWEEKPEKVRGCAVIAESAGLKACAPVVGGNAVLQLGELPFGKNEVKVSFVNLKSKTIIAQKSFSYWRHKNSALPEGAVTFDRYGRVLRDGKPFLPLGIYVTWLRTEKDVQRIEEAGFNFILNYASFALNIQKEANEISALSPAGPQKDYGLESWVGKVRNSLDMLQKHNLKYVSLTNHKAFDHPALLAFYTSDERPVSELEKLATMRADISSRNPFHPVIALTDKTQDYVFYGQIADVLGMDPYPIKNADNQSMESVRLALIESTKPGIPVMFVPQAFSFGGHNEKEFKKYRYPTEQEMRSMTLLAVNFNIKWFCFFSYTSIMERQEKCEPGSSEKFWPKVSAVSGLVRELEPWILSIEKPKALRVISRSGAATVARAFRADGRDLVIVTADGPDTGEITFRFSGNRKLKSRFGKTKYLGAGRYRFVGKNIDSDILVEE